MRDRVGEALGVSGKTYEAAKTIVEKGVPAAGSSVGLLDPNTINTLRAMAKGQRGLRHRLTLLAVDVAEADRFYHQAQVSGDPGRLHRALWKRTEAEAALTAEREFIADSFLGGLAHAVEHRPHEVADLLARTFALPAVRTALVPVLTTILGPTCDWLTGSQRDVDERLTNVEESVTREGVTA